MEQFFWRLASIATFDFEKCGPGESDAACSDVARVLIPVVIQNPVQSEDCRVAVLVQLEVVVPSNRLNMYGEILHNKTIKQHVYVKDHKHTSKEMY